MTPYKGDPPTFMDNKGERWGPALSHEREWWFLFTYIVFINNKSDLYLSQIYITCTWNIDYFANFVKFSPNNKVWKIAVASKHLLQSALQLFLSCFMTSCY